MGVIIVAQGENSEPFFNEIHQRKPKSSEITFSEIKEIKTTEMFDEFFIKPTEKDIVVDIPLTPDFATCESCGKEILDETNPRYFYPFTTCTQCGPRYSVTKKFPFERENTAIDEFKMCPNCNAEYQNPEDVRFHSQTNSCPYCGITIELKDNLGNSYGNSNQEVFEILAQKLAEGKIIALKNTAGYLLICDATQAIAVAELRKRKRRPTKPFAVLFSGIEQMQSYLEISAKQIKHFTSTESPIIVTEIKEGKDLAMDIIAPNMDTIGAMYPYSGTLLLVSKLFGKPIVATSGNFHGSPICSTQKEAEEILGNIADFFLHNTLAIQHPQDDSVVRFTPKHQQKIIFRRSRGFAPNYFFAEELATHNPKKNKILSLGGDLKNTFAIVPNNHVYISEYIGDLANYETYQRFQSTVVSYQNIFNFSPEIILKDLHPKYENQQIISLFSGAVSKEIQHHKAHFASILGERKKWGSDNVLGVIWDGIGYGTAMEIWGGEFFTLKDQRIERVAQLENFTWVLGDKMSKTPKISALSISGNHKDLQEFFDENEWKLYTQFIEKSAIKTSSMGRFFDAVSFILGYTQPLYFEGEPAMWLEKIAQKEWRIRNYETINLIDYLHKMPAGNIPTQKLFLQLLQEKKAGKSAGEIGLNFHYTLIKAIEKIAQRFAVKELAFSGGVWQNALLVDLAIGFLGTEFELHFHEKLSPNDENISFGQLNYYLNSKNKL